jgi:antitoxin component of RelBE/YafQ-DinJ toxin-antitoxin module
MKRKKEFTKVITFDIHEEMKAKFDSYCEERGYTMAEALRCLIAQVIEPRTVELKSKKGKEE